jgi:hypothetical protein
MAPTPCRFFFHDIGQLLGFVVFLGHCRLPLRRSVHAGSRALESFHGGKWDAPRAGLLFFQPVLSVRLFELLVP